MKAQLCHKCNSCTTFCLWLLGCYAEIWVWAPRDPPRPEWLGDVEIVLAWPAAMHI
jgi:hypothetical protein